MPFNILALSLLFFHIYKTLLRKYSKKRFKQNAKDIKIWRLIYYMCNIKQNLQLLFLKLFALQNEDEITS